MVTTEKSARTKWCPMTRTGPTASNREKVHKPDYSGAHQHTIYNETRCIASDCMMWRWSTYQKEEGYCGLAIVPPPKP
jgi:hypothetical protein